MGKSKKWIVLIVGVVVLVAAAIVIALTLLKPAEKPKEEIEQFDFVVLDQQGKEVHFADFHGGKPTVVYFWADWVPLAVEMLPQMQAAYDKWGTQFTFMAINAISEGGTRDAGVKIIEENKFTIPAFHDEKQEAATKLELSAIPTMMVLDSKGNVLRIANGRMSDELINGFFESILSGTGEASAAS